MNTEGFNYRRNLAIGLVTAVAVVVALMLATSFGIISPRGIVVAVAPSKVALPSTPDLTPTSTVPKTTALPGSRPITASPLIRMDLWAWNAQMGLMFANGGPDTTEGSLVAKRGVSLRLIRQDEPPQMQNDLAAFAEALHNGEAQPSTGVHFVAIMGDGAAAFLAELNARLHKKLGPDYIAEVIGSAGYSRGEDGFWGPAEWKRNPRTAMGGLVAGVLRDGDWNIALKWLGDNDRPDQRMFNNPDEKTWDQDALNWYATDDYMKAAEAYVAGLCEDRTVVKKGRVTGEKKHVCVQSVVTWTPGDVTLAKKRGGLIRILSTKENIRQMPHAIIGIRRWNLDNRDKVEGMLAAIFDGGDAIMTNPSALEVAAKISHDVYKEKGTDPAYWMRYYKGSTERDALGNQVELGGSKVNNLADNAQLFGLLAGSGNLFAATYKTFGDIVVQQYPKLVPSYPPVETILNTSYVANIMARTPTMAAPEQVKFSSAPIAETIGRRSWAIQFETGKDTFTPDATAALSQLYEQLQVAGGLAVEVHGHTDNVGGADFNQSLSERRAFAVKQYLEAKSARDFPPGRVRVFAHGLTQPIADNATPAGKASNRRVEIVLGK